MLQVALKLGTLDDGEQRTYHGVDELGSVSIQVSAEGARRLTGAPATAGPQVVP